MADVNWNALPDAPSAALPAAGPIAPDQPQETQPQVDWNSLPDADPNIVKAQKYGTPTQQIKTLAEGAASGPTFGLSRELESQVLGNAKEQKARIEENPGLSTIGELGGILAAPETGLVGAVGRIGKAAEAVADPIVGKILGRVGTKAIGSYIEGSFFGAGNAVTEHALGDSDLNASNIMHNVGYGALWGGALGTALGIGGKAFSPEAETAATKEMMAENAINMPERPASTPPTSLEELAAQNKLASDMGFDGTLPAKQAVIDAQQNLVGDMDFLPHAAQIASLDSPEARKAYDALLKGDDTVAQELRQYQTNQKFEGSQELLPQYIQDIAPDEKLAGDAFEGGQTAIDDFKSQYDAAKAAEAPNFEKLDNIQTNSVSNPQEVLNKIFTDLPGSKDLLGIRADGTYFLKPWAATSGMEKGTYPHFKEVIRALNKDALSIGDIRNLRDTMRDAAQNWEKPSEASQVSGIRKNLMDYMQDQVQKVLPDTEVRDFMRRYAINEQNRGVIEKIFGGSLDDKARFGKAIEPEKVLPRIFSKLENVKAAKELLGDDWNKTVANYLSHLHDIANDPVKGFSSNNFSKAINDVKTGKGLIMDEAMSSNPDQLQKIRDVTTIMRALPDAPPGNPSGTAEMSQLLANGKKWTSALLHPTELLGHIASGLGAKLDEIGKRKTIDRMLSGRAEETFSAKAQKYNAFGKIERMQQAAISKIKNGVTDILSGTRISGAKGLLTQKLTPEDQQKKFEKLSTQIKETSTNPDLIMDKAVAATKDLHVLAPVLAAKLGSTMAVASQFLASKLPAQEPPSPGTAPYEPSRSELATFNRYYNAVNKPLNVLKDVQAGLITTESIEALQSVHPKLYQSMQQELLDQYFDHKDVSEIPYKNRLAISAFVGSDLSNSLKSQNIASAQVVGTPPPAPPQGQQQAPKSSQAGLKNLNKSEEVMTDMQKSAQRVG